MTGTLTGVGLGPGDPELLTLKAERIIRTSKVVAYPAPEGGTSFARTIAESAIPADAVEIPISIPMSEARFPARKAYDAAARAISVHLDAAIDVAVLCQGDPFFYGSFMYLFERLARSYPVEVVPGVTSLTACAAAAGMPLCARMETLAIVPAPLGEAELERALSRPGAAVVVKLGRHVGKVRTVLDRLRLTERAIFVSHATLPTQMIRPFDKIESPVPYFSMVLVPGDDPYAAI